MSSPSLSVQLPVQLTPFVGRDQELRAIADLLTNPACRLLTLIGPGGIGKTRLALKVATAHQDDYADGVYFIPLQPLTEIHHLVPAIGQALGFKPGRSQEPKQELLSFLRDNELLLVFDNFEHLLDGATLLSEILTVAPNVTVLVTSRERLNLLEEWVIEVGGLAVPPERGDSGNGNGATHGHYSAVEVFVQGAQRVRRDFSPTQEQASIDRICRLVGGMPLALELASAWVRALPCSEIADELERSFDILETSARNVTPRHQSMRNVLNYSWARLDDDERDVFMKLSVFRGGFALDAAAAVADASRQSLMGLLDKSWLTYNADTGRYDVHELLRQYGEEQLDESLDESQLAHDRHCQYYAAFLKRAQSRFAGAFFKEANVEVERELENVRASWAWAIQHLKEPELEISLQGLWFFYDSGNRFQEGEQAFARLASVLADAGLEKRALRGKVLARQGAMCYSLDQFAKGLALVQESVALLEPVSSDIQPPGADLAFALLVYGMTMISVNLPLSHIRPYFERTIAIYRAINDLWGIAYAHHWLTLTYIQDMSRTNSRDSLEIASQLAHEGEFLFRRLNNQWGIALAQHGLSVIAYLAGNYQESWQLGFDGLRLFEEIGVHWGRVVCLMGMCDSACALGDYAEARRAALEGLEISTTYRFVKYATQLLQSVADIELHVGKLEPAYELLANSRVELASLGGYNPADYSLLARLDEILPPNLMEAVERGRRRDLDAVVQDVMSRLRRELQEEPGTAGKTAGIASPLSEPLTERELDVLRLLAEGRSNREIGAELVLALGTVKTHVHNICGKLDASSRLEALARARQLAII